MAIFFGFLITTSTPPTGNSFLVFNLEFFNVVPLFFDSDFSTTTFLQVFNTAHRDVVDTFWWPIDQVHALTVHGPCTALHCTAGLCTVLARHCTSLHVTARSLLATARYYTLLHAPCTPLHATALHTTLLACHSTLPILGNDGKYFGLSQFIIASNLIVNVNRTDQGTDSTSANFGITSSL